jgi:hypothetical protein
MVQSGANHRNAPADPAIILVMISAVLVYPTRFVDEAIKCFVRSIRTITALSGKSGI